MSEKGKIQTNSVGAVTHLGAGGKREGVIGDGSRGYKKKEIDDQENTHQTQQNPTTKHPKNKKTPRGGGGGGGEGGGGGGGLGRGGGIWAWR